jgi:hypothetical protein
MAIQVWSAAERDFRDFIEYIVGCSRNNHEKKLISKLLMRIPRNAEQRQARFRKRCNGGWKSWYSRDFDMIGVRSRFLVI